MIEEIDPKKVLSKVKSLKIRQDEVCEEVDEAVLYLDHEIEKHHRLKRRLTAEKPELYTVPTCYPLKRDWSLPIILGFFAALLGVIALGTRK